MGAGSCRTQKCSPPSVALTVESYVSVNIGLRIFFTVFLLEKNFLFVFDMDKSRCIARHNILRGQGLNSGGGCYTLRTVVGTTNLKIRPADHYMPRKVDLNIPFFVGSSTILNEIRIKGTYTPLMTHQTFESNTGLLQTSPVACCPLSVCKVKYGEQRCCDGSTQHRLLTLVGMCGVLSLKHAAKTRTNQRAEIQEGTCPSNIR